MPLRTNLLNLPPPSVTALSSHRSDPKELGQMMGVQQAFGGAARVVAPLLGTLLFQLGPADPFLAASALMLLVTFLAFRVPERVAGSDPEEVAQL